MSKESSPENPYAKLCEAVDAIDGTVRLARSGEAFILVVEIPVGQGRPRVAGYAFPSIMELEAHSLLMLSWLSCRESRSFDGEGAVGA